MRAATQAKADDGYYAMVQAAREEKEAQKRVADEWRRQAKAAADAAKEADT